MAPLPECRRYVLPLIAVDDVADINMPGTAYGLQEGYEIQQRCVIRFKLPLLDLQQRVSCCENCARYLIYMTRGRCRRMQERKLYKRAARCDF